MLMIGRVLGGRYRLVAGIGEGGMSHVWRAQDLNTGKAVAVKMLREEYQGDETFVRRFEREAQAASRMTHPNIANLLDVGQEPDGTRYLVIEYVSGKTLKQFIQESGAIRPDTAAQIIIRVLAAVQHAHQNGVIHRDIKPQNILIDREGTVKVSDFGIARVANAQTMSAEDETVMGSVYYFSPEQANGATVDEKSDLYSVGIVFYEMLTGQVPFTGDTPVAIAMQHIKAKPTPPSAINPAVSPALDVVVLQAMAKNPRARYLTAADMQQDVRLALEHPDTILAAREQTERMAEKARAAQRQKARVEKRVRRMRRTLLAVFSVLLMVVIGVAGYTVTERILQASRSTIEVPNFVTMDRKAAYDRAIALGLQPEIRTDIYPLIANDVVVDQSIAPGTRMQVGDAITLVVCESEYDLQMPNVVGILLADGQKALTDAGLKVVSVQLEASEAEDQIIIRQIPAQGTLVREGEDVTLVVSAGVVVMPRLVGATLQEAEMTISAYQLRLLETISVVVEDPTQVGKVLWQSPDAFAAVMSNASVRLEVGVPSDALYVQNIQVDLAKLGSGTLTVRMIDEQGEEVSHYTQTFNNETDTIVIPLYSRTERSAAYSILLDGVLQYTGTVTFIRP
ncbi:MAG: Stk1 family PASTA domain-containing Ser/Thr kinase [Oscillospiraceae bacterium]|jgi:serine/threonine-protein kinase|nr:Stk1 family PASTA domain-containing Ser/Thr kinase [Oscillospiraceae bacterium]